MAKVGNDNSPLREELLFAYDGSVYRVVACDTSGQLVVAVADVTGAGLATEAKQDTQITALQLIDDLRNALASVATDSVRSTVISSVLPTSAATEATLSQASDYIQQLTVLVDALQSSAMDEMRVDVISELPAGNQNIGNVDVVTMPTTTVVPAISEKFIGFGGIIEESLSNTNLAAGTNYLTGTTVPVGEIWTITLANICYVGTSPINITANAIGLAGGIRIIFQQLPVTAFWYVWNGHVYMQAGDYVQLVVFGATAGDDAYLRYAGHKFAVP